VDKDCDGTVGEGYDSACNLLAAFTGSASDAPGGQRIKDSSGYLYYLSYDQGFYRVPPGGGTSELLLADSELSCNGLLGNVYVREDDMVLLDGCDYGVVVYDPSTDTWEVYSEIEDPYVNYSFGVLADSEGNVIHLYTGTVIHTDLSTEVASIFGLYSVITDDYVYTLESSYIYRQEHSGGNREQWGSGISDGYGLAIGADGSLYVGQGNTDSSTIFKIPAGGGTALSFTNVPIRVTAVIADADGSIYASGYSPNNSLYLIDPDTGDVSGYGCDPSVGC